VEEDMPPPDMPIAKMKSINIKISFDATFGCKYFQKRSNSKVIGFRGVSEWKSE